MNRRTPALILVAAFVLWPTTAAAQRLNICDSASPQPSTGTWILDVSYERLAGQPEGVVRAQLIVVYPRSGLIAAGPVHVSDGLSNTIMVAEVMRAVACVDLDGDERAGLTGLSIEARDVRTWARSPIHIIPLDGEIDESGDGQVIVAIDGLTAVADYRFEYIPSRLVLHKGGR